jgi:hypothetical protein
MAAGASEAALKQQSTPASFRFEVPHYSGYERRTVLVESAA